MQEAGGHSNLSNSRRAYSPAPGTAGKPATNHRAALPAPYAVLPLSSRRCAALTSQEVLRPNPGVYKVLAVVVAALLLDRRPVDTWQIRHSSSSISAWPAWPYASCTAGCSGSLGRWVVVPRAHEGVRPWERRPAQEHTANNLCGAVLTCP
jgi:hypothetical protein